MAYPNPPKTWSAGAVLTAAQMNAELRDALNIIIPTASTTLAWSTYTPTLTQSGTVTKTVTYAEYFQVGKLVFVETFLTPTGAGTANAPVTISLPVTASHSNEIAIGSGEIFDASASAFYTGVTLLASTTTMYLRDTNGTSAVLLGQNTSGFSVALASTDRVKMSAFYEAA